MAVDLETQVIIDQKNNNILAKSLSTSHIPNQIKSKNSKRIYAVFDTNIAQRMFGYRVNFNMDLMGEGCPLPS